MDFGLWLELTDISTVNLKPKTRLIPLLTALKSIQIIKAYKCSGFYRVSLNFHHKRNKYILVKCMQFNEKWNFDCTIKTKNISLSNIRRKSEFIHSKSSSSKLNEQINVVSSKQPFVLLLTIL